MALLCNIEEKISSNFQEYLPLSTETGILYIVATPIGNMGDISERACEILSSVDTVLAEDTRRTGQLLSSLGIKANTLAFHEHNEVQKTEKVIEHLLEGKNIAIVSDAGTPLIRDPGFPLVKACHEKGIQVSPLPGACAAVAALSASGIATDAFLFLGYLQAKKTGREAALNEQSNQSATLIFYEAPHRIVEFMQSLEKCLGAERQACIAREITKVHEQFYSGQIGEIIQAFETEKIPVLGEFVVIVEGKHQSKEDDIDQVELQNMLKILLETLSVKEAVDVAVKLSGQKKNKLYTMALEINKE